MSGTGKNNSNEIHKLVRSKPHLRRFAGLVQYQGKLKLTPNCRLTYMWLKLLVADQPAAENQLYYPGLEFMTGLTGLSRARIKPTFEDLRDRGLVTWDTKDLVGQVTVLTLHEATANPTPPIANPGGKTIKAERPATEPQDGQPTSTGPAVIVESPAVREASQQTDVDKDRVRVRILACASLVNMQRYIRFGAAGLEVDDPAGSGIPHTDNDWTQASGYTANSPCPENWTIKHFGGYYWYLVSWYRSNHGLEITEPNWGRMNAEVKRFGGTPTHLYAHMRMLVGEFDVVRYLCKGKYIENAIQVRLDEQSLNNTIICGKLDYLVGLTLDQRNELRAQTKEWIDG